jgi:hypothetical protein
MTKRTSKITEVCRRAITPGGEGHISNGPEEKLAAVDNVKNIITRGAKNKAIIDEWVAAKEQQKRWRLSK